MPRSTKAKEPPRRDSIASEDIDIGEEDDLTMQGLRFQNN